MSAFERTFFSNLPAKTFNNKPITGSLYLNLAYEYVNAMNSGRIPNIMNSLESVISSETRKECDFIRDNFKKIMNEVMKEMPVEDEKLESKYK